MHVARKGTVILNWKRWNSQFVESVKLRVNIHAEVCSPQKIENCKRASFQVVNFPSLNEQAWTSANVKLARRIAGIKREYRWKYKIDSEHYIEICREGFTLDSVLFRIKYRRSGHAKEWVTTVVFITEVLIKSYASISYGVSGPTRGWPTSLPSPPSPSPQLPFGLLLSSA